MKINEILVEQQLDEGPIDFAKQAIAGIKGIGQGAAGGKGVLGKVAGLATGAKLGWQAQGRENKQLDVIKKVTGNASKDWDEMSQNIKSSTGKPPTAADAVAWFTKFSGTSPSIAPAGSNPTQINQWLQKEVSGYMRKKGATAQQGSGTATQQKPQQTPQAGQVPPVPQSGQGQPPPNQPAAPAAQQQPQAKPAEAPIPLPIPLDKLTAEERAELRRQLQSSMKMAA